MDESLQGPLEVLAAALHRAIEESDEVEAALAELRERGLAAVLLLEVTVALSKAGSDGETAEDATILAETPLVEKEWDVELASSGTQAEPPAVSSDVAPADREFLRSLRIRLD